jgi:SAM-dependent methyltransferase
MTDYLSNKTLWDKYTEIHSSTDCYRLKEFLAGENKLNALEIEEVGPVAGKSLLHLQCHFGMDTLSWARLGASVTGMDFSDKAIDLAASLARELDLPARFICSDLYDLPDHLPEQFDIVFTSYGILTWLPDIPRWARIAASYVKPGGTFYLVEFHPFAQVFDEAARGLVLKYPYFDRSMQVSTCDASYADSETKFDPIPVCEWSHPLTRWPAPSSPPVCAWSSSTSSITPCTSSWLTCTRHPITASFFRRAWRPSHSCTPSAPSNRKPEPLF